MLIVRKTTLFTLLFVCLLITSFSIAQTPGLIYRPAGSALIRTVLDPNGDGFISTSINGFSGSDFGTASEMNMVTLPVNVFEPSGDLNTGSSGGHTDIVSYGNNTNESCYVLYKVVNNVPYLIVRFRLGGASTSTKGYSLLLDVDGNFGTMITANNPGFEKEIVLQTGSNGMVAVYNHTGTGTVLANSYPVNDYHQRSIALSTVNGNPDYFYDFVVPYNDLNLANQPVRIAVATVTSAASGISGTISDFNGINDALYNNNPVTISTAIINSFPATPIPLLTAGFTFPLVKSAVPVVNGGINVNSTSISGTSTEPNGTIITVYKGGVQIGTATVNNNSWTLTGVSTLTPGNLITATALATGKSASNPSAPVEVTSVISCYTPVPYNLVRGNQQTITGNFAHANGATIVANTVRIRLYNQVNTGTAITYTELTSNPATVYVAVDGTWTFVTNLTQTQFNEATILATATYNSCLSGYSLVSKKTSGNVGVITATPTIVTTQILASPTVARTVQVTNTDATASYLKLYINSIEVATSPTTITTGNSYTFTYTGFIEGEVVTARAQSITLDYWLSNPSNAITVTASTVQTGAPFIAGTYVSGSGKTVSGTSNETAGTVINLYKASTTLIGTANVTAYGTWAVTNLTLAAGDILTAAAKATGKTISGNSNSVTVASGIPTAPVITGSYSAGATSVSGTGGLGTVTVFVDGSPIGTATGASWTLSAIPAGQIYKNAIITATNTQNNVQSAFSAPVTVTGVNSFLITAQGGGAIPNQMAGVPFNIAVTAKDGLNGSGNTVATYNNKVVISSNSFLLAGGGETSNFGSGVLSSHTLSLKNAGNNKTITAISTDDPTAFGTATVSLVSPNVVNKLVINAPADFIAGNRASYTITRTDAYDNPVTTGALTVYLFSSGTSGLFFDGATSGNQVTSIIIPDGQSTGNIWFYADKASDYTITASDAPSPNGNTGLIDASDAVSVTAATASKYIVTSPASAPLGSNVNLTATLTDTYGNTVNTPGLTVNWSSTNGGTFSNPTSVTNGSGVANVSFTVTGSIGTQHTINAVTGSYSGSADILVIDNVVTWNGSLNRDWATPVNWTPNVVPNQYIAANIPAAVPNYPLVMEPAGNPATCRELNIYSGASVTIGATGALTVINTIANNTGITGLVIEDGGSLLNNTTSVPATVKRFITGNTDFHLLSVPVTSSTFGAPFNPSQYFNIWIRRYDEPSGDWSNYLYSENFVVGTGYSIYMDNTIPSTTANFTGILNVSPLTPVLSNANPGTNADRKGWNLVGNPYASAIDWDLGSWNRTNVDGAVYVWKDAIGNYVNWNGLAGDLTNGIIPVAQGFFVKVTGGTPSITIPADARVHSSQGFYKGTSNVLRIGVTTPINSYSDATFIGFTGGSTSGFDNSLDAWKLFGELEAPQIYTKINGDNVSINMMPEIESAVELPLYFEAGVAGNYTLTFSGMEAAGEGTIYVNDLLTGTIQDIRKNAVYNFNAETGADALRFKLGFNPLGVNEIHVNPDILVFATNGKIKVQLPGSTNAKIIVTNLAGQIISNTECSNINETTINKVVTHGLYLVTIITADYSVTRKIFIK
ncbi:MAG TPA: T9SS type A sorting domain-containing protein [Lentimicrobium sp.]|nr:T9SS type A sorting domain-containing protein [Lentimicrobium sp.]